MDEYTMVYDREGEGLPLVFIHQVATDRRLWHHQWRTFCRRYRLITVDTLGHGEVSQPSEEFSLERTAGHVQELLKWLQAGPAFLVGVFTGPAIAMRAAPSNPLLVRGLIPINPWSHTNEHTACLVDRLFGLAEVGDISTHTDLFLRYVLPSMYLGRHSLEVERLRALAMELAPQVLAFAWAACTASDPLDCLSAIHVPSLVSAGLYDLCTPPYLARAMADGLSKVEF